jgi:hypothetical protein
MWHARTRPPLEITMRISNKGFLLAGCATAVLGATLPAGALEIPDFQSSPAVRPIIAAVQRGDCDSAVKVANNGVFDVGEVAFVVGRMVNEGICTPRNPAASAAYFERALMLGATGSALDWATKIGLGDGVQQSYERAGEVCRVAGVDAPGRISRYSRGYACTLGGLTAELLRTTLPRGALEPGTAVVEFTPGSGVMEIRAVPRVHVTDADTGTKVHRSSVDAATEITRAWSRAVARAPKPDATILDKLTIEVPIDLDMTLESAAARISGRNGVLQLGQAYPGAWRLPSSMSRDGGH